ncbi:hypothetical protein ACQP2X_25725 [Actinoplanes sp. CA-131856]
MTRTSDELLATVLDASIAGIGAAAADPRYLDRRAIVRMADVEPERRQWMIERAGPGLAQLLGPPRDKRRHGEAHGVVHDSITRGILGR